MEPSEQVLRDLTHKLGQMDMYREVLRVAVEYKDYLPQIFLDKLISMDPQRAQAKSSNPL